LDSLKGTIVMRIGVIGAGKIGALRVQTVRNNPETALAAVFDIARPAADRAVAGTTAVACSDLAAFFDTPMDAVIISTPPHLHEDAAASAFERGLHVLCEKPMSNTVPAARRMVDAAVRAHRVLAVGFNLRYYPFVKFVREAVDRGAIGRVDHVRIFGGHNGLHNFSADWQYKMPESGGGAMMDIGIHMSDLARYFLGEITEVSGVMTERVYGLSGSEDNAMAVFRSPEGIPASYHVTWTEWRGYRSFVEVYGDRGMVRGSYAPMQNVLMTREGTGPFKTVRRFYPEIMIRERLKTWQSTALLSFSEELRDFRRMVGGDFSVPLADGYAGLRSLELAAAVRESTHTSQLVKLPVLGRMRSA
jgi:predicted dehydrogenase